MNRWYVIITLAMIVALALWFTVQQPRYAGPGQVHAADEATAPQSGAGGGHSLSAIIAVIAVLAVSVGFVVVMARLQKRRRKAFKEAAKLQKEEARAADIARKARDREIGGHPH